MNNLDYLDLANYNPLTTRLNFSTSDPDAIVSALVPERLHDECFCIEKLYAPYTQKIFYPHDHQHPMHLKCAQNYLNTLNKTRRIAPSYFPCPYCKKECSFPGFPTQSPSERKEALLRYLDQRIVRNHLRLADIERERNEIDQKLVKILESGPLDPSDHIEILTKATHHDYRKCVLKLLTLVELTQEQRGEALLTALNFDRIWVASVLEESGAISNEIRSSAVQSLLRVSPLYFNNLHLAFANYLASRGPLPLSVKLKLCFFNCRY